MQNHCACDHPVPADSVSAALRDYLQMVTGQAVIGAQYVERVYGGICLLMKLKDLPFSFHDWASGDSSRVRVTMGVLKKHLDTAGILSDRFIERMTEFVQRRNRLVHGSFCETFKSGAKIDPTGDDTKRYIAECHWVSAEAAELVESSFAIYVQLAEGVLADEDPASPEARRLKEVIGSFDQYRSLGASLLKKADQS